MVVFGKDGKAAVMDAPKSEPPVTEIMAEETSEKPTGTSEETFTKEKVEALIKERETKVRSDALADLGRVRAEAERHSKTAQDALARLEKMEKERREAELEAAQDNPELMKALKAEQEAARLKTELAQRDLELNTHREKLSTYEKEMAERQKLTVVQEVAKELNVDPEKLAKFSKFTDGSKSAIEEIAGELPKVSVKNANLKPDSNRSQGGNMTDEAIIAAYNQNPYDHGNRTRYMEYRQRVGK